MFPKEKRIPRKMFPLLLNEAKMFKNSLFLLRFVAEKDQNSRFCFSVSKKVAKNAVVRNKLRRAGYRALSKYLGEIKPKVLAVFSFKKVVQDNDEIVKSLESILKESNLIK
jgi:ribonuclease P protein component